MQKHRFTFRAMACDSVIELYAPTPNEASVAATAAIKEVARIETKFSRYLGDSVVSQVNAAAGLHAVDIDAETAQLLDYAAVCFEQSGGLFDITSGILRRVWDFKAARPPTPEQIAPLLPLIGWSRVERNSASIRLPHRGMEIDFGGFGKEYAADRAAAVLLSFGLRHAFVSLGGDVTVTGPHKNGEPWHVGIRHPRDPGSVIATLPLASGAIASSGDYERFIDCDGRRFSHILDPRSGESIAGWQSVTVIAPSCLVAGSVSTIALLKGIDGAAAWLNESGTLYFAVDEAGRVVSAR